MTNSNIPKIGTKIILTDDEMIHADFIGKARQKNNEIENTKNQRVNEDVPDVQLNIQGARGEIAFCKLFNRFPDMNISTRTMKEDKGDVIINGKVVDVKTSKGHWWGDLLVPLKHRYKTSIYAYAQLTCDEDTFIFRGFYLAKDAYNDDFIKDIGHGDTFVIPEEKLREKYDIFNEFIIIPKKNYENTNSND